MRANVERKTLAEAAASLERIAPTRASQPAYSQVYLRAEDDRLVMRATNGELDLELAIPAEVEETGALAVPANLFGQLVRSAPGERVALRESGSALELESGAFATKLTAADPESFPEPPEVGGEVARIPPQAMVRAISTVRYAAAHEEYRAIFRGVQLELYPQRFRAVATDGFRLALYDVEGAGGEEVKLVVPARSADELVRVAKDASEPLALRAGSGKLAVEGERFRMVISLMEGTFPDYQRVIPGEFVLAARFEAEPFRQAVERLRLLADRQTQRVDLVFSEGKVTLGTEGEYGQGREELVVETEGEVPFEVSYNAQYLIEALKALRGATRLKLSGAATPSVITSEEDPGYRAVVVPLRV